MKVLEMYWSRALSLVCEVALLVSPIVHCLLIIVAQTWGLNSGSLKEDNGCEVLTNSMLWTKNNNISYGRVERSLSYAYLKLLSFDDV